MDPPSEVIYLWTWLCQLSHPLSFTELTAWMPLVGVRLSKWEVDALIKLDRVRSYG